MSTTITLNPVSGYPLASATLTRLTRLDTDTSVTLPSPATFTYSGVTDLWTITATLPAGVEVYWEATVVFSAGGASGASGTVIGASSDAGGGSSGTMTLATARTWVARAIRDGGDTSAYSTADIDRAIVYAGQFFCRETKCVRRAYSVAITDGDDTPSIAGAVSDGFIPERRIDAILDGEEEPLKFIDYAELNRMVARYEEEGTPEYVAFLGEGVIKLYPEPDEALTLYLRYWQPFTSIDPGVTAGTTLLNIPEAHLPFVLSDGAAAVLLFPSPEKREGSAMYQRFLQHIERLKGANSLGSRLIQRCLPESRYGRHVDPDSGLVYS